MVILLTIMRYLLLIIFCFLIGCVSEDDIKDMQKTAFQAGVYWTIEVQDKQRDRFARCSTYGDVMDLAWERYMLKKGLEFLIEHKK